MTAGSGSRWVDSFIQKERTKNIYILKPFACRFRPGETVPAESQRRLVWQPGGDGVKHPVGALRRGEGLDARQPDHVCHQVQGPGRRGSLPEHCLLYYICLKRTHPPPPPPTEPCRTRGTRCASAWTASPSPMPTCAKARSRDTTAPSTYALQPTQNREAPTRSRGLTLRSRVRILTFCLFFSPCGIARPAWTP